MAEKRSGNKGRIAVGAAGVLAVLGLAGGLGHHDDTQTASESRAAATSTSSSSSSAPATHRTETLHAAPAPSTTTSTPVAPPPPVPAMAMTCPAGGSVASPVFGEQITATAPYTVVIDYGDGDVYTNDDQHLGAVFSHTYHRAGTFTVDARLTDATGQSAVATCAYSWAAPSAPSARSAPSVHATPSAHAGGSAGTTSTGGSTGDTYTNVDGNQVQSPVEASSAPPGATAHCNDGTWSFSQHRQGTCSGHGGVAEWL